MAEPKDLQTKPTRSDVVSIDELDSDIVLERKTKLGGNAGTMDPLAAYAQEAIRMERAGPRRRITAYDLDRREQ